MEKKEYITNSLEETQSLAQKLAGELIGGEIICLDGELGAGKTTFAQGLLAGLGVEGPYTSPTFLIMKEYKVEIPKSKSQSSNELQATNYKPQTVYHIDAYRIGEDDLLNLGWEEMIQNRNNIVIVEWPERVEKIIPPEAIKIRFEWTTENQRKITFI
jgi:tRNA threonylcarbamoyladenosine biosynthesis protein TsaE